MDAAPIIGREQLCTNDAVVMINKKMGWGLEKVNVLSRVYTSGNIQRGRSS
jgi:hypothetical protein